MIRIRLLLLATALSIAAACGKAPETQSPAPAAAATEPAPIAAAADAEPDATPVVTAVEESAGTELAGKEPAAPPTANPLGKEIVLAAKFEAAWGGK